MKLLKFEDKNKLESKVFMYRERRDKVRWEYGWENGKKMPPEYHRRVSLLNKRINTWNQQIVRIGKKRESIPILLKHIYDFMGVNVKECPKSRLENDIIARGIYYKYGIEKASLHPLHLSEYIKMHPETGARARIGFNKSFVKYPERKNMYNRFLLYLKDIEADGI